MRKKQLEKQLPIYDMDENLRSHNLVKEDLQTFQAYMEMVKTQVAGQGSVQELVAAPILGYSQPFMGSVTGDDNARYIENPSHTVDTYSPSHKVVESSAVPGQSGFVQPFIKESGHKHNYSQSLDGSTYPISCQQQLANSENLSGALKNTPTMLYSNTRAGSPIKGNVITDKLHPASVAVGENLNSPSKQYLKGNYAIGSQSTPPAIRKNFLDSLITQDDVNPSQQRVENFVNNNQNYNQERDLTTGLAKMNLDKNVLNKEICQSSDIYPPSSIHQQYASPLIAQNKPIKSKDNFSPEFNQSPNYENTEGQDPIYANIHTDKLPPMNKSYAQPLDNRFIEGKSNLLSPDNQTHLHPQSFDSSLPHLQGPPAASMQTESKTSTNSKSQLAEMMPEGHVMSSVTEARQAPYTPQMDKLSGQHMMAKGSDVHIQFPCESALLQSSSTIPSSQQEKDNKFFCQYCNLAMKPGDIAVICERAGPEKVEKILIT